MPGTCLITLLLIFISSRYFFHKARRDIEKGIVIQIKLDHVQVQRFKKNKMDEKITFSEDMYMLQREQIPLEERFSLAKSLF